jgi:hypothetical protein
MCKDCCLIFLQVIRAAQETIGTAAIHLHWNVNHKRSRGTVEVLYNSSGRSSSVLLKGISTIIWEIRFIFRTDYFHHIRMKHGYSLLKHDAIQPGRYVEMFRRNLQQAGRRTTANYAGMGEPNVSMRDKRFLQTLTETEGLTPMCADQVPCRSLLGPHLHNVRRRLGTRPCEPVTLRYRKKA